MAKRLCFERIVNVASGATRNGIKVVRDANSDRDLPYVTAHPAFPTSSSK